MAISWNILMADGPKANGSPLTPDSPFLYGKHRGTPINRVPRDYLEFAVANHDLMRGELRAVTRQVLGLPPEPAEGGAAEAATTFVHDPCTRPDPQAPTAERTDADLLMEIAMLKASADRAWGEVTRLRYLAGDQAESAEVRQLRREVAALKRERDARQVVPMKITDTDRVRAILKQWYRAMSLIHHPDRGGSKEKQAVVNACYEDLQRRLEGDAS